MHITAVEAALAGSALTATASTCAVLLAQGFSRRTGHAARLWEHRVEAYEYALLQASWWEKLRAESMRRVLDDDRSLVTAPDPRIDESERERLSARLDMFNEPEVREAFDVSGEADKQFVVAFMRWRHAAILNTKAARGDVPRHVAIEGKELVRLRKEAEAANTAAGVSATELTTAVHKAIERMPRRRRGWISRILAPVRRRLAARKRKKLTEARTPP